MNKQPTLRVNLLWSEDQRFEVTNDSGVVSIVDGQAARGLSPMEGLLAALAGCMASDVVTILGKMRARLQGLSISVSGERKPTPPRYFRRLAVEVRASGDIAAEQLERAVRLSVETYCSVFHSLRKDLELDYTFHVVK